jgi:hypothetical protein
MRRILGIAFTVLMLSCIAGFAAEDDWKIFLNSSAVFRIRCIGDSLWCSTSGGALLFDLTDSTFTQCYDGLDFPSVDVRDIAVDGEGSVWFGFSTAGIIRIDDMDGDPRTTRYDVLHNELLSDSITCLAAVGDEVYYGSVAGVAKIRDDEHITIPELATGLAGKTINYLFEIRDTLWVACEDGAGLFDIVSGDFSFFPLGRVTSMCDYGAFVYCAGDTGTAKFVGGAWEPVGSLDFSPVSIASGGGELVCATDERAYRWGGLDWISLDATGMKTLFDDLYRMRWRNILRAAAVDARGVPWVGGVYEAANRGTYVSGYAEGAWFNEAPEQISHNRIVELAPGDGGGLWASTNKFGIGYLSDGDRWTLYTRYGPQWEGEALSFLENNLAVLFDSQGYLWCNALNYDLDRIRINDPMTLADDEWDHYAIGEGTITSNRFVKAKEDPGGNRWFLSDGELSGDGMWGINIRRAGPDEEWFSINPSIESRMQGGSIFDCVFDVNGRVYLAIRGYGIQRWSTGGFAWTSLTDLEDDDWLDLINEEQLTSTIIHAIERGQDGSLYLGTSGGMVRYMQGVIDSIPMKTAFDEEGLIGSIVYDLELDGSGNLWVATDGGLNRIDAEGTIAAFTSAEHWESELQLIYSTNVIAPLPNHVCRALQYDPVDDVLWIGTDYGLVRLDVSPPAPEPILLSDLVLYPNPVNISRGDNALRIARISESVTVRIYTVEGELVHEASGLMDGDVAWDLLTINGFKARSGVYIVRIEASGASEMRKIAVVR